jgi:soluble lytic murein transglycosylase-like protein
MTRGEGRGTENARRWPAVFLAALVVVWFSAEALAGAQRYEPLAASVRARLSRSVSDVGVERTAFTSPIDEQRWLKEMSRRLNRFVPDEETRLEFLTTLHYEASRAGLDPQMVLGLIQVESGFRKYAVSSASARGYMQVMPFWTDLLGAPEHNLFHLRINLRYGCTILRHYVDQENGDLFRALGRYNGSLGKAEYPNVVLSAWRKHWSYEATTKTAESGFGTSGG